MNLMKVAGAIVAANGATIFLATGSSHVLSNDNYRTAQLLEYVLPKLAAGQGAPVEVDLDAYSIVGKAKELGLKVEEDLDGKLTIDAGKAGKIEAGALDEHVERAVQTGNAKGLKNFLKHYAKIERKHTSEELLNFMKRHRMPLADDGSIICFKILMTDPNNKDRFVDCHSQKVSQKLGSLVWMPGSRVDDNRARDCGVGLHVCSISYTGGFSGNVITLVKVKPNDIVSVPRSETNKMRACAYHIVAVIPPELHKDIRAERMEDGSPLHDLINKVIVGDHVPILERVSVDGKQEVVVAEVKQKPKPKKIKARSTPINVPSSKGKNIGKMSVRKAAELVSKGKGKKPADPTIDPVYAKKVAQAKKLLTGRNPVSLREVGRRLGMCRDKLAAHLRKEGFEW